MATYVIGDVQGCYDELRALLDHIDYQPKKDKLWFSGDLVNRGPKSLAVLRFVVGLQDQAITVLGNHDLHLLAVAKGKQRLNETDTLTAILQSPDRERLLAWLRQRPLLHHDKKLGFTLVHAGLPPQWDLDLAKQCANEVEAVLRGEHYQEFLGHMYGNQPNQWQEDLTGWERLRFITNCFTRLRYCNAEGILELRTKGDLSTQPKNTLAWFNITNRANKNLKIVFGHWAALYNHWQAVKKIPGIYPVDSGCVWGNKLTALRLDDEKYFQVDAKWMKK